MVSSLLALLQHPAVINCKQTFLGFVPWDYYLTTDAKNGCVITDFHLLGGNSSLLLILLAIIDDLLRLAGVLAVGFIIYSGFQFITSSGSADQAAKARQTGINALIGLGIALVAITFVEFLGRQLGTGSAGQSGKLNLSPLPNPGVLGSGDFVQTVLGIVFGVMGALAFMIIIIAGMRYTLSQGDPKATSEAKATILYAIIGLVIAITAESIVSFAIR